jgi:transposase
VKFDKKRINQERKKYELSPLPSRPGHPRLKRPGREELVELYVVQGLSLRETAKKLRMKKDTIQRALKEYRIKRRSSEKRSRLDKVNPEKLYSELAEKGLKRTAERFGVTKRTLQYFLARKRREGERKASSRMLNASARSIHKTPRKEREA